MFAARSCWPLRRGRSTVHTVFYTTKMTSTTPAEPPERLSLGQPVPVASHIVPISTQGGPSHSAAGTSLVNPVSLALSLPHSSHSVPVSQVDAQALNYLTLEMPHVLRASTRKSAKRRRQGLLQMKEEGFDVDVSELRATNYVTTNVIQACQEIDEEVIKKLEVIGSHVGASFIERCVLVWLPRCCLCIILLQIGAGPTTVCNHSRCSEIHL